MEIKKTSYVVIQEFMLNLGIKGAELTAYAVIYGFSQDGETWFTGSSSYIAKWACVDRVSMCRALKRLVEKRLIIKREHGVYCDYKANIDVLTCNETSQLMLQKVTEPVTKGHSICNKTSHHNLDYITRDNLEDNIEREQTPIPKRERKARTKSIPVRDNPPTLGDVQDYFETGKLLADADNFYSYYTASEWRDKGGNDILNWKLTATTWSNRERMNNKNAVPYKKPFFNESGQRLVGTIQGLKLCPNPKCEGARLTGDTCPKCKTTYALDGSVRYKGEY